MTTVAVTETITAEDSWTSEITPARDGFLNIAVWGTFVATVTLLRKFPGESSWGDHEVDTFSTVFEGSLVDEEGSVSYKIGVDMGNYTSGTVYVRLSK